MKNTFLTLVLLASTAAAGPLPDGSYKGASPRLKNDDVMSLIVRGDYAVLAEYTRLRFIPGPERLEITNWVPRTYFFKVTPAGDLKYALKPQRVSASGELEDDPGYLVANLLTLKKKGTLDGAVLSRYDKGSAFVSESIAFDGKLSSTWEDYVPGNYFGSKDATGNDYLHKAINTVLSEDMKAEFAQDEIKGKFDITKKAPGVFTFKAVSVTLGAEKVTTRIGVFIDIVNWKPFFTTDELLLINPDDAKDVGFYYERH
jgi:hypothetical protein